MPYLSIAENIFLGNERSARGAHRLEPRQRRGGGAAGAVGLRREPGHAGRPARRRQAAAGRDRQGAVQEGEAADPRRADGRPQRQRLRAPARPAAPAQGAGHHLDHDLAQAQRDHRDRRLHHGHPRRPDGRDAGHAGRRGHPGADHPGRWSAATWTTFPPHDSVARRGGAADRGLDGAPPHPGPDGRRRRQPDRARRRGRRHRRADGRRAHRAGDERVRPVVRPRHQRPAVRARPGGQGRAPSPRPSTTASRTPPRTARRTASTSSTTSGATSPPPPATGRPAAAGSTATRRSRSPRTAGGA